uniref:TonB-dependent receptor domain-containing protein n=1 Tax=Ningiella ruwaisensis TaxID=2364274 RepID=UPI0010A0A128|nr:TonB-dependent receptor [Ningiella ruwaisensis]
MKTKTRKNQITLGILLAMGMSAVSTTSLQAQETETEEGATEVAERIQVVGSRIRTDAFANENPIDIISVDAAKFEGVQTLGELLRTSTAAAGASQLTAALGVGFVTAGGAGAESVSLRGLGANRTLVLVNGRRAGPAGVRGQVAAFDLNSIPISAIERIEILKDGASALYGSDAVAGVVNIILRKGDDKNINVDVSAPEESGGETFRINGTFGEEYADGSFRVTVDYEKVNKLARGDRNFFNCTERLQFNADGTRADPIDPRTGRPHCSEAGYGIWLAGGVSNAFGGSLQAAFDYDGFFAANGYDDINNSPRNVTDFRAPGGWYPVSFRDDYASEGWWNLRHPYLAAETVIPEETNASIFATGDYKLTEDITMFAELIHSRRQTEIDNYRQFWIADIGFQPASVFEEFGFSGDGFLLPVALTDHFSSETTVDYTRGVVGLSGDIGFWSWEASYQQSHSSGEYAQEVIFQDSMIMSQLNLRNNVTCSGEVTEFSGRECVDINWTDPNFLFGNRTDAQNNFLFGEDIGNTTYKQQTFEAFITGDLFELPAGEVATAVGVQWQRDEINDVPGQVTLDENSWGLTGAGITAGAQTSRAVFGELRVPLLEGLKGIETLDLTASGRYTDVDTYGSDTTFKLGANWTITDGYAIRASRGTSFRAPALFELFLAEQTGFGGQIALDPCFDYVNAFEAGDITDTVFENCQADGIPADYTIAGSTATLVTSGGAGRLEAETSVSESLGFVFTSPEDTFAFSIDYFKIEIQDEVAVLGGADIISRCYNSIDFANEPLCDLFTRRDGSDNNDFGIERVNGGYVNISQQIARGVDYNFTYQQDFDFGTIRFDVEHTMQIEREALLFSDSPENNLVGENGNPKHVGIARLSWSNDDYFVQWSAQYFDSTNDYEYYASETNETTLNGETVTFIDEAPWTTYHTVSAATSFFDEALDVTVGVANVFDDTPPVISASGFELGNAARFSQYDSGWRGRRFFANVTYNF